MRIDLSSPPPEEDEEVPETSVAAARVIGTGEGRSLLLLLSPPPPVGSAGLLEPADDAETCEELEVKDNLPRFCLSNPLKVRGLTKRLSLTQMLYAFSITATSVYSPQSPACPRMHR